MTKLTPFDSELIVMVCNLTGKEPGVVEKENVYTLTVDMAGKSDNEKKAIDDAICGRIYPRLKRADYTHYKGDIIKYDIMYYADFERLPVELRAEMETPGFVEVGKRYCRKLKEVFAIQFTRENKADVVEFCGKGIVEIPRTPNALGKFTFANANGVFQQANESDVICTVDGNVFEVMRYSDFVAMYEPWRHPHTDTQDIRTKIAQKAFEVRQLQKAYFKSRDKIILTRSKQEERELDAILMQYFDSQK